MVVVIFAGVWVSARHHRGEDPPWGGWKHPECEVRAGALNHADLDPVLDQVGRIPWRCPRAVQVFLMDQEQMFFRLWMFRDGRLRQYAPTSPTESDPDFDPPDL
ncbi:hypothetical protein SAMN05444320_104619 [Streptoalloteichus hindustanus]|uniref:Uncharacterized protein n=1 Tax=Streptoalloteichus hindustanus TaxID=2017 RepID=A0A1M5DV69_STRHI|nr:hypothetical protein SAMN05444320_104619 [Streptoalloteichus hindustanus]